MKKCRKCSVKLVIGENISPAKAKRYDWICKACMYKETYANRKKLNQELRDKSKPGVYGIYYDEELVYVGESTQCEFRFWDHKQTHHNTKSYIGLNKSYIKDYTLKIFKEEEDLRLRRQLEMELIVKHKPCLNYPYREPGYVHNL